MKIVVCGSIAFDYLMHFPGAFREHILPANLEALSVSFLADSMRRSYGGVGANIAYNLGLLGEHPLLVGSAGRDFDEYGKWLRAAGVDTSGVLVVEDEYTSSFFVTTDDTGSQIATFYVGAMSHADETSLKEAGVTADDIVIVSPDKPEAMLLHVAEAKELGARLVFDPSQQIPRLSGPDLTAALDGCYALTLNEYEYAMLKNKTGLSDEQVRKAVPVLVVTAGSQGSGIWAGGEYYSIPSAPVRAVADPTGVGDAYRAGLVRGLTAGLDWPICGRMGSVAACYVVEHAGTQEHRFTPQEFVDRFRDAYGEASAVAEVLVRR
jgi:adenosine kinase